jgi:rod shape-determining protein MreC
MNKRFLYPIIAIFLAFLLYFQKEIKEEVLWTFNTSKIFFNRIFENIYFNYKLYFDQVQELKTLKKQNILYQKYINQLSPMLENYKKLKQFKTIKNPNITFAQTISYANLPDMSSIYINYTPKNTIPHPQGLIYNNQAAGIVAKNFNGYSLAYLINNSKAVWTVFVGQNKIPGIFFGGIHPVIKYIPKYEKIKVGDEVVTSGLDKIFYEGVAVGRVNKIIKTPLYQEAWISVFYNPNHPTFFYVVGK